MFDFNVLRTELGLPTLEPIDPAQASVEQLPLVRLARLEVEKLGDDVLLSLYRLVLTNRIPSALEKFAKALAERPKLAGSDEFLAACRLLAQTQHDPAKALHYIGLARKSDRSGRSCASLDFQELDLRLHMGQADEANRLLNHVRDGHLREPGVAEALYRVLVQVGAIGPDGRPIAPSAREQPGIVVPGAGGAEPGKIWTPDSETPGAPKSKLWTPD